jgi:hypothetical protein
VLPSAQSSANNETPKGNKQFLKGIKMLLTRTAHKQGTIIESPEVANYFGFEDKGSEISPEVKDIFTRIWVKEEEGVEVCTSTVVRKYKKYGGNVVVEISSASCGGTVEEIETKIKELQLAIAIAKSY